MVILKFFGSCRSHAFCFRARMGFTSGLLTGAYLYVRRITSISYASNPIALTVVILSADTPIPYSPVNKKHASRHPKNFNTLYIQPQSESNQRVS